ncbi:DUF4157 domain-containing protein [Streptomyces acidiscabies]|uniref:eCIS core domain-containing protein n=1 Tax=Streptomyces acidiscabies TaxID=42234 RepID=UPI0038F621C1
MRTSRARDDQPEVAPRPASVTRRETPSAGAAVPPPLTAGTLRAAQRGAGNAAVAAMIARRVRPAADQEQPEQRDPGVHKVLASAGRPLSGPVRKDMEARFNTDFSDVRLHTGPAAAGSADAIGARAYTSGSHVVLGAGGGDRHTLAHELTHVVQQRSGPVAGTDQGNGLHMSDPSDRFEREAETNAHRVLAGPAPQPDPAPATPDQEPVRRTAVQRAKLEDVLPREEWYRAYLDPLHHKEAREKFPANPGELYDHDKSPGFQGGMTAAYETYLNDPATLDKRVDFAMYEGMHNAVGSRLTETTDKSGTGNFVTSYPLRADSPTPSVLDEEVGGKKLMVKADALLAYGIRPPNALTWTGHFEPGVDMMLNQTLYKGDEVQGLVDEVLSRFYGKLDAASTLRDRLKAIGWVVRTIHIIHPYDDTNRRLNVHVLLPRLLLASGLRPVIFKDMEELFQGGRSLEQIADALESGQAMDLLSDEITATAPKYEADWWRRNQPAPRPQTTGTIEIPDFGPMGTTDDAPSRMFGQQAREHDFFIPGLGGPGPDLAEADYDFDEELGAPGPAIITEPSGRDELREYLTETLRQAREDAA